MRHRTFLQAIIGGLALGILLVFQPAWCLAGGLQVDAGYDLFTTDASQTSFPGLGDLKGVPLGTYNFGSGSLLVGDTDTIIKRNNNVSVAAVGDTGTTSLSVFALQLETVTPVNFGGHGLNNYYVTLQSIHGGPASTGSMEITFNTPTSGTFKSSLDMYLDIRAGSATGTIVDSFETTLTNSGTTWSNMAPPGSVLIDGINNKLNGTDTTNDFWPSTVTETHPGGGQHVVDPASVPEPNSLAMVLAAILMGLAYGRRHNRRS